jgi:hypothetical protein
MLLYLSMKEGSFFCFVLIISPKPWCFRLCYWTCHQKVLNGQGWNDLVYNVWSYSVESIDYWTIFLLIFLKNQDWKLYWKLGVFLVLLESPHQVWFNKVDFVILKPKMWILLLNLWWVSIVVGNSNKLQKGVWKENSIKWFKLGPMT